MTITNYKTPDSAIFGLNSEKERVYYRDVRAVTDNKELINLQKIRNKIFFIDQVQVLDDHKSAFPLVYMTILGVKNITKILNGTSTVSPEQLCNTLDQMNVVFTQEVDVTKYAEFWDDRSWKSNNKLSYIFYNLVFPELKKGYVLDYSEEVCLEEWENTFFKLNPGWFWNTLKNYMEIAFDNLSEEQENLIANYIKTELLQ